ncbi:Abi family protein [bacterium]|nr:Abi family protein [bacterium]
MINVLAKSFVPLYKSFTQEALGDIIKFFSKLSENIQVDIIEDHFPLFYQKVTGLIQNDKDSNLILIGTFISLLDVFKNLRNKIAHLDIAYNF